MKCLILKNKPQTGVSLYQIGYEKCSPYHTYGPVERDFFVLHFVIDGQGTLEIENKTYPLNKGDLFLLPINKLIRYSANINNPYEYYWIGFSGSFNQEILENIGFKDTYVLHTGEKFEEILSIFKQLDKITSEDSVKQNMASLSIFYNIISVLTKDDFLYEIKDEKKEIIFRLVDYIEQSERKVTIEQLENVANMHRSNIYRSFIHYFKKSPSEFILDKQLEKSLYLLKNTTSSIKEISLKCGFNSQAYFCKMFKQKFCKTPAQARKLK